MVNLLNKAQAATLGGVSFTWLDISKGQGPVRLEDGGLMLAGQVAITKEAHSPVGDDGAAALQDDEAR